MGRIANLHIGKLHDVAPLDLQVRRNRYRDLRLAIGEYDNHLARRRPWR